MKKMITAMILLVVLVMGISTNSIQAKETAKESWSKYPDNSSEKFASPNYSSIDQKQYTEYKNAKMNIREKVSFKDVNKVLSKADKFIGENRVSGDGFHPNRQVYVYLTVSENGKDIKNIIVDAETKKVLFKSEPLIKR